METETKKRGRPRRRPIWHEGEETTAEEALWPYAECVIGNQIVKTQNIGVLKGLARDKAKNKRKPVQVTLHLPDGTEVVIAFEPSGTQVLVGAKK